MKEYWSWGLSIVGITGIYLAGSKNKIGWLIGIFAQFLWITFAIQTKQYGFILASLCYGAVYLRNYLAWRKSESQVITSNSYDSGSSHDVPGEELLQDNVKMMSLPFCRDCKHLMRNNSHGFDQNDGYVENGILIHYGKCTYCKVCRGEMSA